MFWKKKCYEMESDDDLIDDLLYATVSRDVDKVDELMQCGIDPCTPTKDGTSPIHKAALIESPSGPNIISKMLSYGADPNVTTPTGLSPLHIAAMWGRVETLDVLLDSGADVSLKDIDDMSALDYTEEADENKDECIDALTRYRPPVKRKYPDSPHGYAGDVSENNKSCSLSESTFNDCFWSPPTTPNRSSRNSPGTPKTSSRNSPGTPKMSSRNSLSTHKVSNGSAHKDYTKEPKMKRYMSPKKASLFVPISPHGRKKNCEVLLKISVVNNNCKEKDENSQDSAFENDFDSNSPENDNEEIIENLSNILRLDGYEGENCCETYMNFDSQNGTIDIDGEATVDYSNKSVPVLVQYYEEKKDEVDGNDTKIIEKTKTSPKCEVNSIKVNNTADCNSKLLNTNILPKQEGIIAELAEVNMEYDWKDISDIGTASEFEESFIVPGSILSLSDNELRSRLKKAGETPGPISDTTRKLYQKYLTRLEKNNYRPLKPNDKYKDYTAEMRQVLNGNLQVSKESGELLEAEMAMQFTHPEKHTWREGSMKTSFNYLLLDPRVTNNLPERAKKMSYVEKLRVFMASVFYIGKGKKSRPYEHLYEAIKVEKNEKNLKPPSNKLKMIYDIWAAGLGVVSLHVFHSVIPVEAFTREACMIEAMGLTRLTNAKSGDFYGDAASWSGKKRRQLGIYILSKAMEIYVLEGERQIRQMDLVK